MFHSIGRPRLNSITDDNMLSASFQHGKMTAYSLTIPPLDNQDTFSTFSLAIWFWIGRTSNKYFMSRNVCLLRTKQNMLHMRLIYIVCQMSQNYDSRMCSIRLSISHMPEVIVTESNCRIVRTLQMLPALISVSRESRYHPPPVELCVTVMLVEFVSHTGVMYTV